MGRKREREKKGQSKILTDRQSERDRERERQGEREREGERLLKVSKSAICFHCSHDTLMAPCLL